MLQWCSNCFMGHELFLKHSVQYTTACRNEWMNVTYMAQIRKMEQMCHIDCYRLCLWTLCTDVYCGYTLSVINRCLFVCTMSIVIAIFKLYCAFVWCYMWLSVLPYSTLHVDYVVADRCYRQVPFLCCFWENEWISHSDCLCNPVYDFMLYCTHCCCLFMYLQFRSW